MNNFKKPTMLMILDGFGINNEEYGNAIKTARTPNLDRIFSERPFTTINASGEYVGLPDGQMGNSEVGHLNIGAGRIIYQELTNISNAIVDGRLNNNTAINEAIEHVKENKSTLHVFGLLSDGGVHSHINHIKAVIKMAREKVVRSLYLHCFMDGRDVPPTSGVGYIEEIESYMKEIGLGHIGVVSGRYYAMDRDKRWERVKLAYDALTRPNKTAELPIGVSVAKSLMESSYMVDVTDEFILPALCDGFGIIEDHDSIIFCNFRPDRARELTRAFVDPEFESYGFKREKVLKDLYYVTMTEYDKTIPNVHVAFPPETYKNTLGEYVSSLGLKQLRIAETEKYAHVTFFFNGGVEEPNPNEDRILIPSPKVATYDLKPEMSAPEVAEKVIEKIDENIYDLIILNFANSDMVGHTGVFDAAVKAVEALDKLVGDIVGAVLKHDGQILLTADHGNSDTMINENGEPITAHSTNPVPLSYIGSDEKIKFNDYALSGDGKLADLAPTLLKLMRLEIPEEMTGKVLI